MVAKAIEWKMEKIKHEFDSSFDAYPELRIYAVMAANYLDHESGMTYATDATWSVKPDGFNQNQGPVIRLRLKDPNLGIAIENIYTPQDLKGRDAHYLILRSWSDFLRCRSGALTDRLFTRERKDEEIQ